MSFLAFLRLSESINLRFIVVLHVPPSEQVSAILLFCNWKTKIIFTRTHAQMYRSLFFTEYLYRFETF